VLLFVNLSDDPAQEYFGDGITEDIIAALSKLRVILVIASSSTFAYEGKVPDIRQVARELGIQYVLEDTGRKPGERLRVMEQLASVDRRQILEAFKALGLEPALPLAETRPVHAPLAAGLRRIIQLLSQLRNTQPLLRILRD
jgi:hypothetical protein